MFAFLCCNNFVAFSNNISVLIQFLRLPMIIFHVKEGPTVLSGKLRGCFHMAPIATQMRHHIFQAAARGPAACAREGHRPLQTGLPAKQRLLITKAAVVLAHAPKRSHGRFSIQGGPRNGVAWDFQFSFLFVARRRD